MGNENMALAEIQRKYQNCNLLLPTATDAQINPFYKFHVEEVPVDLSEGSGDIYRVGASKTGTDRNGKDVYEDVFSLSKPLLNRLAMAAGIQFDPVYTKGERIDTLTYRATARGAIKKADGTARIETDQKVICLEDEKENYILEFSDKAKKGISDYKQAKAASELFKGEWKPMKNRFGKTVDGYFVAVEDQQRYIDRSVMVNMALLKKTWAEKAMTGAKLRVIRALLGLKGTYTMAELRRNFVIPTVVFAPDYNDPAVRQAMLMQGISGASNMFGTPSLPVSRVEFDAPVDVNAVDLDNPAFASDQDIDDYAADYQGTNPQPMSQETPQEQAHDDCVCERCGIQIPENVRDFSVRRYGAALCRDCQREM